MADIEKKSVYELDEVPSSVSLEDGVFLFDTADKTYKIKFDTLLKYIQEQSELAGKIWIKFKFHSSYNPAERQLAVGKAITGTDKYGNANKKFSAKWVKSNFGENVWYWIVTEGTNLSSAFVYGDGTGVGIPMISGEDYISGIPEDLTYVEGGTVESLKANADDWRGGKSIDPEDYVPECEIIAWDLDLATDITSIIGTNVWFKNNLVGTLPSLVSSKLTNISYAFDRCWNITSMGEIDLPNCGSGANNAFMSMMALTEVPVIKSFKISGQLNNTFNGCLRVNKTSIENAYEVLSKTTSQYGNCFKKCGYLVDEHALDNIPTSWGGNKA